MAPLPRFGGLLLIWLGGAVAAAGQQLPVDDHVPPGLRYGKSPAVLYQSLDPAAARRVDLEQRVHVFEEHSERQGGHLVLRVQSLGVIDARLPRVARVLRDLEGYPSWMVLSPSYKQIEVLEGNRLRVRIGKHDRAEAKTTAIYEVETAGSEDLSWAVVWRFVDEVHAFQPGSFLHYTLQRHPDDPTRTLVLHTQETRIDGWMAKRYLRGEERSGWSRHREDAAKHARRIHWALAVAAGRDPGSSPSEPTREERIAYALHHQREFGYIPVRSSSTVREACEKALGAGE